MNFTNFIFIDESGKPEVYSAKGANLVEKGIASRYLVLAAVRTDDQLKLQQEITEFRLSLLKDKDLTSIFSSAYTLNAFHAQVDYPQVRKRFYEYINTLDVKIDVLVVEKLKCFAPLKQNPGKLYGVMAGQPIKKFIHPTEKNEKIFNVTARIDTLIEIGYYQHGGVLQCVLRQILARKLS